GVTNMLWTGFENTWPLMQTPAQALAESTGVITADHVKGPDQVIPWSGLPLINTLLLLSSSVTVHFAHVGLKNGNDKAMTRWLGATIILGFVFVGFQAEEYVLAYTQLGLTLESGVYGATFFMLTGFHGLHVCIGAIMLSIMWLRHRRGHFKPHDHFGFEAASWYWHFVDVVWVGLFLFVYIL
ncbi:MAG: cytochrome c oxidase subunit 3, partial [Litorivicinus sp.]